MKQEQADMSVWST